MPLGEEREEWTVWLTRERLWERYRTLGQIAVLEGEGLEVSFLSIFFSWNLLLFYLGGCADLLAENSQGLR
jgi:hypothetical protein